ncbi:MAG: hypothetical protein KIT31_30200 [Deltaproteobacteria bacterium]|nr:hypothetical protein [Deltaproteobacteria bacterium]
MRRACVLAVCVAAGVVVGLRTAGAAPSIARPAELMAVITVSEPSLAGFKSYLNAVVPGTGAALDVGKLLQMSAVPTAGLDVAKAPVHLLVTYTRGAPGVAVLAKVTDAAKVNAARIGATPRIAGGWALLATRQVDIDAVAAYAFGTVARTPPPTAPTATLFTVPFLAEAALFLATTRMSMPAGPKTATMSAALDAYIDAFLAVGGDADAIEVRLEADADLATLDAVIAPRAGTRFAQFAAAQKASDFGLIAKLPASHAGMLFAGRLATDPYRDQILGVTMALYTSGASSSVLSDAIAAIMKAASGEFAMVLQLDKKRGLSVAHLFGIDDAKAVDGAIHAGMKVLAGKGVRIGGGYKGVASTWTAFAVPVVHDGVSLRGYRVKLEPPPNEPAKRAQDILSPGGRSEGVVALVDGLGMTANGLDGALEGGRVIDAMRGRGARLTLSKTMAQLVDYARARRDSALIAVDAGAYAAAMGLPVTDEATFAMSAGFADGSAHVRTLVPAASVRAAIGIAQAANNASP